MIRQNNQNPPKMTNNQVQNLQTVKKEDNIADGNHSNNSNYNRFRYTPSNQTISSNITESVHFTGQSVQYSLDNDASKSRRVPLFIYTF